MKPAKFDYYDPRSLEEALTLLDTHQGDGKVLAGGQSLMPLLNMRLARPNIVVDINRIKELNYVRASDGGIAIGALARQRALQTEKLIAERVPILQEAAYYIAHPQIRSRGTICGSIAHADPAAELPALALALDAEMTLTSAKAARTVGAETFFQSFFTTALEANEILTEVRFPAPPKDSAWSVLEISRRHGDFAIAGIVAGLALDPDRQVIAQARMVYFGVGPTPIRVKAAEDALIGQAAVRAGLRSGGAKRQAGHRSQQRYSCERRIPPCRRGDLDQARAPRRAAETRKKLMATTRTVKVRVNGVAYEQTVEARKTLVDFLREDVGLTGTNVGCEHGVCGACTILMNGEAVRSCIMLAAQADGAELMTVEGLAKPGGELHPIQESFREKHGLQCGFCTPGFLMTTYELLNKHPDADEEEIKEWLSGHLCRCTGYQDILESVKLAASRLRRT